MSTLLGKRDEKRGIDLDDYPKLKEKELYLLLQDLSYWMVRNRYVAAAPKAAVEQRLEKRLKGFIKIETTTGSQVLRLLTERSGVVREPSVGKIAFTHRTFQEFLAAEAIVDEGDVKALEAHLDESEWHEITVLTMGLASKQQVKSIFRKLVNMAKIQNNLKIPRKLFSALIVVEENLPNNARIISMLALDCLSTIRGLDEETKDMILQFLEYATPPASFEEALIISRAGVLAIPFLTSKKCKEPQEFLASIDTLEMIGSDEIKPEIIELAMKAESYEIMGSRIFRLWETRNADDAAMISIVQKCIDAAGFFRLENPENLFKAAEQFDLTRINALELMNCENVSDWQPYHDLMRDMHNMIKLKLGKWKDLDASRPLYKLPVLREIQLDTAVQMPEGLNVHGIRITFAITPPEDRDDH